jgi:hypothetical protein
LPDELQWKLVNIQDNSNPIKWHRYRLSKTIPTEVTDFLKFINHRTGAVFIAFGAYTNEDGKQIYARQVLSQLL